MVNNDSDNTSNISNHNNTDILGLVLLPQSFAGSVLIKNTFFDRVNHVLYNEQNEPLALYKKVRGHTAVRTGFDHSSIDQYIHWITGVHGAGGDFRLVFIII